MDYHGAKRQGEQLVRTIENQTRDPHERYDLLNAALTPLDKAAREAYNQWVSDARRDVANQESKRL